MIINLSPYEKDRIIAEGLGRTEMGLDMLAQDYLLKQLTASLMYPDNELGTEFWNRVHTRAYEKYGTTEIPMNTFNKIWILPETASVYVNKNHVFVAERYLKVMLEEDYLALETNINRSNHGVGKIAENQAREISEESKEIIREILIPEIEKEVNQGKNFANLRQIFNSMILATWYKQNLRDSFLSQSYANQNKVDGIQTHDTQTKEDIYNQYVKSFEIGVYDFIREEYNPTTQEVIPRKYFSGGLNLYGVVAETPLAETVGVGSDANKAMIVAVRVNGPDTADAAMANNDPKHHYEVKTILPNQIKHFLYRAPTFVKMSLNENAIPVVYDPDKDLLTLNGTPVQINHQYTHQKGNAFRAYLTDGNQLMLAIHAQNEAAQIVDPKERRLIGTTQKTVTPKRPLIVRAGESFFRFKTNPNGRLEVDAISFSPDGSIDESIRSSSQYPYPSKTYKYGRTDRPKTYNQVEDEQMSRSHFSFDFEYNNQDAVITFKDLNSTNGTFFVTQPWMTPEDADVMIAEIKDIISGLTLMFDRQNGNIVSTPSLTAVVDEQGRILKISNIGEDNYNYALNISKQTSDIFYYVDVTVYGTRDNLVQELRADPPPDLSPNQQKAFLYGLRVLNQRIKDQLKPNYTFVSASAIDTAYTTQNRPIQDHVISDSQRGFAVVADGVGGATAGHIASEIAAKYIIDKLTENLPNAKNIDEASQVVTGAIIGANNQIACAVSDDSSLNGMATTISVAQIWIDLDGTPWLVAGNVGDSRMYIENRYGNFEQISKDDSARQRVLDNLDLTEEEALDRGIALPPPNIIEMALAGQEIERLEESQIIIRGLNEGDKVIVASDGLYENLHTTDISDALSSTDPNQLESVALKLVESAKKNATLPGGKKDDMSIGNLAVDLAPSQAMISNPGGIDFNPMNLNLQTQGDADPIQFNFDPAMLADFPTTGFYPVIINVTPVSNFPMLLGETQLEESNKLFLSKY